MGTQPPAPRRLRIRLSHLRPSAALLLLQARRRHGQLLLGRRLRHPLLLGGRCPTLPGQRRRSRIRVGERVLVASVTLVVEVGERVPVPIKVRGLGRFILLIVVQVVVI